MKNWKNILLTALAVVLLAGFTLAMHSPVITDEAYDAYLELYDE